MTVPGTACCARCRSSCVEGIHTTVPAHELVLNHPDFAAGHHSTNWLENEVDLSGLTSEAGPRRPPVDAEPRRSPSATVPVEVDGKRFDVKLWLPDAPVVASAGAGSASGPRSRRRPPRRGRGGDGTVNAPMQGTIVKVLVERRRRRSRPARRCSCSRR